MRSTANALEPADNEARDLVARLAGKDVLVRVVRPRSLRQWRMYWQVLQTIAPATEWETAERLHVGIKIHLGLFDRVQMRDGRVVPVPHSTSFWAMSADEANEFVDNALRVLCEHVVPHMTPGELRAEAERNLGIH